MKASDFLAKADLLDGDGRVIDSGSLISVLEKLELRPPAERSACRVTGNFGSWDSDTAREVRRMYHRMSF